MKKLILFLLISGNAISVDLGRQGFVFPIEEESIQKMIIRRLKKLDLEEYKRIMEAKIQDMINNPRPACLLPKATEDREFSYDPRYFLKEDVLLSGGLVLYKKGDSINPLDFMDFDSALYFIDGDDRSQVIWFTREILKSAKKPKLVLIKGSPMNISDKLKMSVYFDQYGSLIKQFDIKKVPAIVWQEGDEKWLRVKEVALE